MFADLSKLRRRRSSKWLSHPADVLPAFIAESDVELAPPVRAALHRAIALGDTGYTEPDRLFESFAAFAARRLDWSVDPALVRLVPDVVTGIVEALRVLVAPRAGVVVTPPVYAPFFDAIREAGHHVVEVPLQDDALDLDGTADAFAAGASALLLCSPHNPTGRVIARSSLETLLALAEHHRAPILSSEIHAPLTLAGATHTPLAALGESRSVTLMSASKAFNIAGLKCAVLVAGSEETAARLDLLPADLPLRAGILGVTASVAAFDHGDAWLDALLAQLAANRDMLGELLAERLPQARFRRPDAGFLAWLDCRRLGLGDDPAAAFLERGRVALQPGLTFGAQGRGFARINFATSPDLLDEVVHRMAAALS
jgi:cystathionine beta-lyase